MDNPITIVVFVLGLFLLMNPGKRIKELKQSDPKDESLYPASMVSLLILGAFIAFAVYIVLTL
jgi:hypothetical protein